MIQTESSTGTIVDEYFASMMGMPKKSTGFPFDTIATHVGWIMARPMNAPIYWLQPNIFAEEKPIKTGMK